jgi:hypothetical protein
VGTCNIHHFIIIVMQGKVLLPRQGSSPADKVLLPQTMFFSPRLAVLLRPFYFLKLSDYLAFKYFGLKWCRVH